MRMLSNIFWLGTKELRSFMSDFVLLGLVIYSFSLAVISQAQSNSQELHNASIAFVDEDHSELSRRIVHAFLPPYFKTPVIIQFYFNLRFCKIFSMRYKSQIFYRFAPVKPLLFVISPDT